MTAPGCLRSRRAAAHGEFLVTSAAHRRGPARRPGRREREPSLPHLRRSHHHLRRRRRRSAALAGGLLASGLAHGSRVGLLYPNGPEFAVASLAAARIGAVAVPFSTFSTAVELRTLLNNADVDMLLAAPGYRTHDYVQVLCEAVPELDLGARPPLFSPSVPALRRVAFDSPEAPSTPGGPSGQWSPPAAG